MAVNVALLAPAGTVTPAGTVSVVVLLESVTAAPPEPAAWNNVTVHVAVPAELRLAGVQDNELKPPELGS